MCRSLLVFTHIDPRDHVLVIEQELRQRLRQLGLADACRTHEEERADGPVLVREARPAAAHRVRDGLDGRILPDHTLVQLALHPQQLLLFALEHPLDGDAGPLGDDLRDVLRRHRLRHDRVFDRGLLGAERIDLLLQFGDPAVTELRHLAVVAGALGCLRLDLAVLDLLAGVLQGPEGLLLAVPLLHQLLAPAGEVFQFLGDLLRLERRALALDGFLFDLLLADGALEFRDRLRHRIHLQTQLRGRLVDQVDRLVGQETVRDVPVRQVHCRDQRVVLDPDPVVVLVFLLQAPQDGDRLSRGGLVDQHHLEPALQRLVRLEVLLVLVVRRGADGPQLAPRQGRFQDVGRIHCARRPACAHQGVDLIDEEDDLAGAVDDFLHDALQPLLEFTLVLRACDQRTHVQGIDLLALEVLGDIAVHDLLGDPFRDRRLADTRLTDQDRVVLGPPAQDLQHAPDLVVTSDDGVEPAAGSLFVQVDGELVQEFQFVLFCRIVHFLSSFPARPGGYEKSVRPLRARRKTSNNIPAVSG